MDKRDIMKKTALGVAAVAATSLLENPVMAYFIVAGMLFTSRE